MVYLDKPIPDTAREAAGFSRADAIQWTDGRAVSVQAGPGFCYLSPEAARKLATDLIRAAREVETGIETTTPED